MRREILRVAIVFAQRPPSTQWESLPAPDGAFLAWTWWKPAAAPREVIVRFVGESGSRPSVANLVAMLGLDLRSIAGWLIAGQYFDAFGGQNPVLAAPLPGDPDLQVHLVAADVAVAPPAVASPLPQGAGSSDAACEVSPEAAERLLAAIDADWNSVLKLERDLSAKQKEVQALLGRINTLNRDLSADERRNADSNDLRKWQDTKRWLRDSIAKLSKVGRDFDLGQISAAGSRNQFEAIHRQHIVPRKPFAGISRVAKEFEQHRRTAQQLLQSMSSAYASASRDGEGRAKQVLAEIAAKGRRNRAKR